MSGVDDCLPADAPFGSKNLALCLFRRSLVSGCAIFVFNFCWRKFRQSFFYWTVKNSIHFDVSPCEGLTSRRISFNDFLHETAKRNLTDCYTELLINKFEASSIINQSEKVLVHQSISSRPTKFSTPDRESITVDCCGSTNNFSFRSFCVRRGTFFHGRPVVA